MAEAGQVATKVCRRCQAPIIWVKTHAGASMPMDARATVYHVSRDLLGELEAQPTENFYVSHFSTCTNPEQFSGKNAGKPRPAPSPAPSSSSWGSAPAKTYPKGGNRP